MRLVYVQYGDYAEAYRRLSEGGPETYQAQRHTVRWVAEAAREHPTTVVCLNAASRADETVADGRVRCIGRSLYQQDSPEAIAELVASLKPDAVICRTPLVRVLDWTRRRGVPCLPLLADSSKQKGLRPALRRRRLARVLRSPHFACVANHSLSASRWLTSLGVPRERIVPWEFPAVLTPGPVKRGPAAPDRLRVLYVGAVIREKGVGDLVEAMGVLERTLPGSTLTVAGAGVDLDGFRARATELAISAQFLGPVPYDAVTSLMREHDAVVVPSQHAYPEGLPNTVYEGLVSGTPLLVSDHPVMAERLADGHDALVFRASDPSSLAAALVRLHGDPALYHRLSANGGAAYRALYVGVEWSELTSRFIADPHDRTGWVEPLNLAAVEGRLERRGRMVRVVLPEEQLAAAPERAAAAR